MAQIISTTLSKKQDKVLTGHIEDYYGDTLYTVEGALQTLNGDIIDLFTDKQDKLVSGTSIKTINNTSLLGSGNISITASVPTEIAQIKNSSGKHINIERYSSENYAIQVCHGKVSINAPEKIDMTVTFASEFTSAPTVVLSALINNKTDTRQLDIELTNVSTKGFNFSAALSNSSYKITEIYYVAIQTK